MRQWASLLYLLKFRVLNCINSFSPGDALNRHLQIKYTLIRQPQQQELSDQGTLFLLMLIAMFLE